MLAATNIQVGTELRSRHVLWVLSFREPIVYGERMGHATATSSAICSSARRPGALRARDTYQVSKMSSQDVLRLLPLLTAHSTWQRLQSPEDKERNPSRGASS